MILEKINLQIFSWIIISLFKIKILTWMTIFSVEFQISFGFYFNYCIIIFVFYRYFRIASIKVYNYILALYYIFPTFFCFISLWLEAWCSCIILGFLFQRFRKLCWFTSFFISNFLFIFIIIRILCNLWRCSFAKTNLKEYYIFIFNIFKYLKIII